MSENEMLEITTEMMEHICDNLCKHPIRVGQTQDELVDICVECKMGEFVCKLLNRATGQIEIKYSEDAWLTVNVTDKMLADWRACREMEEADTDKPDNFCVGCSLFADVEDVGLCDLPVIREELERRTGDVSGNERQGCIEKIHSRP